MINRKSLKDENWKTYINVENVAILFNRLMGMGPNYEQFFTNQWSCTLGNFLSLRCVLHFEACFTPPISLALDTEKLTIVILSLIVV
jgi:hypothetical protein